MLLILAFVGFPKKLSFSTYSHTPPLKTVKKQSTFSYDNC